MPWWLALLIKYGVPWLLKKDHITEAQASAIYAWAIFKKLKTYPEYPTGRNGT